MVQFEHYTWKSCKTSNSEILHFAVLPGTFLSHWICVMSIVLKYICQEKWLSDFGFSHISKLSFKIRIFFCIFSRWRNLLKNSHKLNKRIYISVLGFIWMLYNNYNEKYHQFFWITKMNHRSIFWAPRWISHILYNNGSIVNFQNQQRFSKN